MSRARRIAVACGVCLIGLGVASLWFGAEPGDAVAQNEETTMAETIDRSDEARLNYSAAPEPVQELAVALFNGTELPPDALAAATPEMLSTLYATPDGNRRNLLLDAFGFDQLEAGRQLAAAGADVNVGDHLLARGALVKFTGTRFVPFADFSAGMPWLRIYAEHGGDLNAKMPDEPRRLLHRAAGVGNLEGLLFLLDNGADGWLSVVVDDFTYVPFFERMATRAAGVTGGELLFRIAQAGHLQSGTPAQLAPVLATLERMLEDDLDATGPTAQRIKWQVQTIAQTIVDNSAAVPSPRLAELLAMPRPDIQGGWHLGPEEVRSASGTPEAELDFGTTVWAE